MKTLLCFIIMSLLVFSSYSQATDNSISIVKKRKYYQNEQKLKYADLKKILSENKASSESFNHFQKNNRLASPFMIAGGILILAGGITNFIINHE